MVKAARTLDKLLNLAHKWIWSSLNYQYSTIRNLLKQRLVQIEWIVNLYRINHLCKDRYSIKTCKSIKNSLVQIQEVITRGKQSSWFFNNNKCLKRIKQRIRNWNRFLHKVISIKHSNKEKLSLSMVGEIWYLDLI
jgi:hypothetical protein